MALKRVRIVGLSGCVLVMRSPRFSRTSDGIDAGIDEARRAETTPQRALRIRDRTDIISDEGDELESKGSAPEGCVMKRLMPHTTTTQRMLTAGSH